MIYEGKNKSPVSEYWLHGKVLVVVKDELPNNVSLSSVLRFVEKRIPYHLFYDLDSVYIGQFEEFIERDINAFYRDGGIFVTNDQIDNQDLLDDIVHEIAHSVEELHDRHIYEDRTVESEFLGKRRRLYHILSQQELDIDLKSDIIKKMFLDLKYSSKFDNILYRDIGYPLLSSVSAGLFTGPYSITSLREYFATGFEEYYIKDKKYLSKLCPSLYKKIDTLNNMSEE